MRDVVNAGVYDFHHPGGTFDVHLRSGGHFFAPMFKARGCTWEQTEDKHLLIDFGKFGDYRLDMKNEEPPEFEGSAVSQPSNWRKMNFKAKFTMADCKLMNSVWNFEHAGGSFPVEFVADSFNHFVCKDFPSKDSFWLLHGNVLYINWGCYGEYELVLDESGEIMAGGAKGNAANWSVPWPPALKPHSCSPALATSRQVSVFSGLHSLRYTSLAPGLMTNLCPLPAVRRRATRVGTLAEQTTARKRILPACYDTCGDISCGGCVSELSEAS